MVNPDSPIFKFSEKIGLFVGKGIRYIVVWGFIVFIGSFFGSSNPSPEGPKPPAPQP
jgi:hypothetical protein